MGPHGRVWRSRREGVVAVHLDGNQPGGNGVEQDGTVRMDNDGTFDIPPALSSAVGRVFTEADIERFPSMVADGGPGLFGLQLSVPDFTYTIGSMLVSANQDVRVFATAPRVSVTFEGDLSVNGEDARLTVRGSIVELLFGGGTLSGEPRGGPSREMGSGDMK